MPLTNSLYYRCYSISGGGTEQDEGIFVVKSKTAKFLNLEMLKKGYFGWEQKTRKIPLVESIKGTPQAEIWSDGSFTVYHGQAGTPFIYEPLTKEFLEEEIAYYGEFGETGLFLKELMAKI